MEVPEIDVDALAEEIEAGAAVLDVRQPHEYEEAHVPGAVLLPLDELPERVDEVPAEETVFVICQAGGRSRKAAEFLRPRGIDAINVAGGTGAWLEQGKPAVEGPEPA